MDLNTLPPTKSLAILKWCEKRGLTVAQLAEIITIINGKQSPPANKKQKKGKTKFTHDYRALRNAKEKTQDQVAEEAPINIQTLRQIESSKGNPRASTLETLNKYYEVE